MATLSAWHATGATGPRAVAEAWLLLKDRARSRLLQRLSMPEKQTLRDSIRRGMKLITEATGGGETQAHTPVVKGERHGKQRMV